MTPLHHFCITTSTVLLLSLLSIFFISSIPLTSAQPSQLRFLSTNLTSIHFIGDIHGDVECAKEWIKQTNLVDLSSTPYQWLGQPTDAIVFLGDYVDKGSTSASVLTFVKELQTTFVNNVVTILGNHDFFQVLDAALEYDEENPHPLGHPQHDYAYSFVHPEEYIESGYSPLRDDDDEIMMAIYEALNFVYDRQLEGEVRLCTSDACIKDVSHNGQGQSQNTDIFAAVPPFSKNKELADKARERLTIWRNEYMNGLYESGLLQWMIEQPLLAIVGDTLLCHGGVAPGIINYISNKAKEAGTSVEDALHNMVNKPFTKFFQENLNQKGEGKGANSIKERLKEGYVFEIILNIVQHRGYFKQNGCQEVQSVIDQLQNENVNRICVGHTPRDYAEEYCAGKLLASDSALSRSFRAHGNLYCPLRESFQDANGISCSRNSVKNQCEGSISVLVRESPQHEWPSNVKHLTMDDLKKSRSVEDEL
jgi:hypothetical protein